LRQVVNVTYFDRCEPKQRHQYTAFDAPRDHIESRGDVARRCIFCTGSPISRPDDQRIFNNRRP